ncbi:RHS repeat-associated core domain-containing protein [Paenactinomyces guangxiensis]|uniref:RHS repeat-associated core domain-containing protein n=3 Tax=Paenactinomyces guangxiensis TaxID=1490290 RepID=A0A7W1WT52_9BACL|nr:RHS repeat-associated core domain-containing protein [Paenactinomyces guangxiensis]MBA4495507.1 RHS repeat-associated core domain-containing protein [Paenactinomyces guangxiensis]MBH8593652.1 RHS repeat-associated core domain-containing protein [Paenactinomyces guangxiensis]
MNKNIRATYGYTPYGENDDAMFTGADQPDPSQPDKEMYNPFRYGGKRWDPYTESYDLGFRNYFPGVGRFMSPDSYTDSEQHKGLFMDAMTNSLYSFTDGNPVSYVDLDGHVPLGGDDACMRAPVSCYTANTGYYYDPAGPKRKAPPKAMKRAKRTLDTLRKKPTHNKNKDEEPPPRNRTAIPINTVVYAKAGGYGYAAAPPYRPQPLSPEAQLWIGGILFALAVLDPLPGDEALVAGALGYAGFRMKSIINSVTGKGKAVNNFGVVQSRINIANGRTRFTPVRPSTGEPVSAGWEHVLKGHFNRPLSNSRSIFSISPDKLKSILQRPDVVKSPVTAIEGGQYVRTVNVGEVIGNTALKYGGKETTHITIMTDKAGNLITTYPVPAP